MSRDQGAATGPVELDADACERVFFAALKAGDARGVEASLIAMAARDPERAQVLYDSVRLALVIARGAS